MRRGSNYCKRKGSRLFHSSCFAPQYMYLTFGMIRRGAYPILGRRADFASASSCRVHSDSGVTRLDGARGKKQVWRPHVRT